MKNTNTLGSSAAILFFFLASLLASFARAQTAYSDGFEGPTINSFWTVVQQYGTVGLSTDLAHTGHQSIKLASASGGQRELHLKHVFPAPVQGTFSVWFYDAAPGQETLYEKLYLFNSTQPGVEASIGTQDFDAHCYSAELTSPTAGSFGENAACGIYPQLATTHVVRTAGWHLLSINVTAASSAFSIDGTTVFSAAGNHPFDTVDIGVSGPYWRPDTVAYFDDFSFVPAASSSCQRDDREGRHQEHTSSDAD